MIERVPCVTPHMTARWIIEKGEEAAGHPEVFYLARSIVRELRERDPLSEALAISDYVSRMIRYTSDPKRFELVFGPNEMIRLWRRFGRWAEDCDSIQLMTYALLRSVGHLCRVVLVGFQPHPVPEHIILQTYIEKSWYVLDASESKRIHEMLQAVRWLWNYGPSW